jgi:hypothetical protein
MEAMVTEFVNNIVIAEDYNVFTYLEDSDPRSDDLHRCEPQTMSEVGVLWGRTIINGEFKNFNEGDNTLITSAIAQCIAYPIKDVYAEYSKWGVFIRVITTDDYIYEFNCYGKMDWSSLQFNS